MSIAWFSPLPPIRSGVAAYSAELLPHLERTLTIDRFDESRAHDFVWKHRRAPDDLVVYQLGNAPCHDYMWAYLAAYPGLVVLHDARLHHARARCLLSAERADDYRREFWYDHPDAPNGFVEYAVAGLGGPIYYFWSMLRVVMRTARLVAVHNDRVAAELRESFPGTPIETIRLGKAAPSSSPDARGRTRAALGIPDRSLVFAVFGKLTAEKRIAPIVRAFSSLVNIGFDAHLMLVGDGSELRPGARMLAAGGRIHVTGHVSDEAIGEYLAAADVCLCLRWPTALRIRSARVLQPSAARPLLRVPRCWITSSIFPPLSRCASIWSTKTNRCSPPCSSSRNDQRCAMNWRRPVMPTGERTTPSRRRRATIVASSISRAHVPHLSSPTCLRTSSRITRARRASGRARWD